MFDLHLRLWPNIALAFDKQVILTELQWQYIKPQQNKCRDLPWGDRNIHIYLIRKQTFCKATLMFRLLSHISSFDDKIIYYIHCDCMREVNLISFGEKWSIWQHFFQSDGILDKIHMISNKLPWKVVYALSKLSHGINMSNDDLRATWWLTLCGTVQIYLHFSNENKRIS